MLLDLCLTARHPGALAHQLAQQPARKRTRSLRAAAAHPAGALAQAAPPGAAHLGQALRFRSVFISDLHLGTPQSQADTLLDFLQTVRVRRRLRASARNCAACSRQPGHGLPRRRSRRTRSTWSAISLTAGS